tara:strand:+ start:729 stop:866 length:138 start_codon:yes stop_codon:yes gene_type:complete
MMNRFEILEALENRLGTDFSGATADETTIWPEGFDPVAAGVIFQD